MLWLKFLLGGLVVAFCILLGYLAAEKYRARRNFFTQFSELNEKYLAELKFARKPLSEFLSAQSFQGDFWKMIKDFPEGKGVKPNFSYLKEEEKKEICEYFAMFGKGDAHSQSGYFSAKSQSLNAKREQSLREAKSYSELYLKLGLLAGLALVILIV